MKKKLLCGIMSAMMILSLAGCGEEKNDKTDFSSIKETDYSQYMTLSDYKSIRADVDESELEVTDEEVKKYVEYYRSQKMNAENIGTVLHYLMEQKVLFGVVIEECMFMKNR